MEQLKNISKKKSEKVSHHQAVKFVDLCESSEESLSTDSDTEYNSESSENKSSV